MLRIATLALVLLLAPAAYAALTPDEREELVQALDALSRGPDGEAGARAGELFRRSDTSAAELEGLLSAWYAERPSNQYLTDSAHTLALAQARLAEGRSAPLDQFLFFADVYSQGRDSTLFFAQDEECNYSAYLVRIRRDPKGRIERILWPGGDLRFQLDRDGFVVR